MLFNLPVALAVLGLLHEHFDTWPATLLMLPAYIVLNAVLVLIWIGSAHRIARVSELGRHLGRLPNDAILVCRDRVVALVEPASEGQATTTEYYRGSFVIWGPGLVWSDGSRLGVRVKRAARIQLRVSSALFVLVFVPALLITLWAGVTQDWKWFVLAVGMFFDQGFPVFFLPDAVAQMLD